jgi:hypothetical protein
MVKRKQAPAASSKSLASRKSFKNVDDRSASRKGFPTAFEIAVNVISKMNKKSYDYIYQVPLRPGQELYAAIGTLGR